MSKIFRFASDNSSFSAGSHERPLITENGCNEPYKNKDECDNFVSMCGKL